MEELKRAWGVTADGVNAAFGCGERGREREGEGEGKRGKGGEERKCVCVCVGLASRLTAFFTRAAVPFDR